MTLLDVRRPPAVAALAICTLLTGSGTVSAQAGSSSIMRQIADGKPWNLTILKDNRAMKLTLNPDGTGKMEGGPMTMTPSWREAPGGMCMKPMAMLPEKCVTFRRDGAAIIGVNNGEPEIRLQR